MLALNRLPFVALHFIIPAALVTGCVITDKVDTDHDHDNSSGNTSGPTSGSGGSGGSGGQGGSGGGEEICAPTYPTCVGETAQCSFNTESCTKLNIAPEMGATQCDNEPMGQPPGYRVCNKAFSQFHAGAAEHLYTCLYEIGVQNACDTDPVQTCMNEMFDEACAPSAAITEACTDLASQCPGVEATTCADDMKIFSIEGFGDLVTCINESDPNLTCQEAFEGCYEQAFTF